MLQQGLFFPHLKQFTVTAGDSHFMSDGLHYSFIVLRENVYTKHIYFNSKRKREVMFILTAGCKGLKEEEKGHFPGLFL